MSIQLNHTIVSVRNKDQSAFFLADLLGLPTPKKIGPFTIVKVGETSMDFIETKGGDIHSQHYAFLVSEVEFDDIFKRIQDRRLLYWADPSQSKENQINTWDGGRGVYWEDPSGHLLEILTRPYGSGGSTTINPHPLFVNEDK